MILKDFPKPIPLRKMLGPSFILLGLGLGSGEIILWPYLTANYGLGIIWGAILGITLQSFLNLEISRYALARGESVFVGFSRVFKFLPFWFVLSTFAGFGLPGIAAASAKLLGTAFGISNTPFLTIVLLLLIGLILSFGKILYKTVERFAVGAILVGIPTIAMIALILTDFSDWQMLGQGLLGIGEGYRFFPPGLSWATFLAAVAYAGAGGNLNLAQSFYVKAKGYGMGKYASDIKSVFREEKQEVTPHGFEFRLTGENVANFKAWWKRLNLEHFLIFWLTGGFAILLLALLSYATTFGLDGNPTGLNFVLNEARAIGLQTIPLFSLLFLLLTGLMLFSTQFTVLESTSRIISENLILGSQKINPRLTPQLFYLTLWLQILFGILVITLGFSEPRSLIVLGAVLNAAAMFVGSGLILVLNKKLLPKVIQPSLLRQFAVFLAFLFYGALSLVVLLETIGDLS